MKIVFTGGGTGGHFYPIIAVSERVNRIADEQHLANVQMYYFSDAPYDESALEENHIEFQQISAGKMRLYFSVKNIIDIFKTGWGIVQALYRLFTLSPDVVFGKGGYASFPTLFAARILRIPVMIHESDSAPGRVGRWAGKFAKRIAVSYPEAAKHFDKTKTAWTGQPVRLGLMRKLDIGGYEYLKLDEHVPVVWIIGGSLGAKILNDSVLEVLPELIQDYQIIHQTGAKNYPDVLAESHLRLEGNKLAYRYKVFPFLDELATRMSAGISRVVVTRAGSMLFEIAGWKIPAIVIPISKSIGDHQMKNAYNYARTGAGLVIEEANLTPSVLKEEIDRVIADKTLQDKMKNSATEITSQDAADVIGQELVQLAIGHMEA